MDRALVAAGEHVALDGRERCSAWLAPGSFVMLEVALTGAERHVEAFWMPAGVVSRAITVEPLQGGRGIEVQVRPLDGARVPAVDVEVASEFGPIELDLPRADRGYRLPTDGRLSLSPGRYTIRVHAHGAASDRPLLPVRREVDVPSTGFARVGVEPPVGARLWLGLRAATSDAILPGPGSVVVRGGTHGLLRRMELCPVGCFDDRTIWYRLDRVEAPEAAFELSVRLRGGPPLSRLTTLVRGRNAFVLLVDRDGAARALLPEAVEVAGR